VSALIRQNTETGDSLLLLTFVRPRAWQVQKASDTLLKSRFQIEGVLTTHERHFQQ
jgi:hypothetical protein